MDKSTKKYVVELATGMAARLAILGAIVLMFVLGHMYRGSTYQFWQEFINMLQ